MLAGGAPERRDAFVAREIGRQDGAAERREQRRREFMADAERQAPRARLQHVEFLEHLDDIEDFPLLAVQASGKSHPRQPGASYRLVELCGGAHLRHGIRQGGRPAGNQAGAFQRRRQKAQPRTRLGPTAEDRPGRALHPIVEILVIGPSIECSRDPRGGDVASIDHMRQQRIARARSRPEPDRVATTSRGKIAKVEQHMREEVWAYLRLKPFIDFQTHRSRCRLQPFELHRQPDHALSGCQVGRMENVAWKIGRFAAAEARNRAARRRPVAERVNRRRRDGAAAGLLHGGPGCSRDGPVSPVAVAIVNCAGLADLDFLVRRV